MKHRIYLAAAVSLQALTLGALPLHAETFSATIASGHPPVTGGVQAISEYFIPEVNRRLEAAGGKDKINWNEAYGGSLADPFGVLEAVESGIADFGYVPQVFEADKLPLEQITYVAPFGTSDLGTLMAIMNELHAAVPEMDAAWRANNQMPLAFVGVDTYQLVTNFEVTGVSSLKGRKLGAAGLSANWLRGTGAVAVSASLPDHYNNIKTGLTDGVITFESSISPYKFYEVAPYVTKVNFGAMSSSSLTVNLDTWARFPKEVQDIIKSVAQDYEQKALEIYATRADRSLATAKEKGAKIVDFSESNREEFVDSLPNIAQEWASDQDARGQPGSTTLQEYLRIANEKGVTWPRDWSQK
ncbi:C4-dicarboxylate TRAP transporter substrate-binding protein [Martelella soudanensis]|uniref:C4-dicarboxylate TRAP transporter substrate-binding protein n=1 Tax=unclassified Martelella TaxID=2629616 RepID=UPI0015DEF667|nr:MULTISPECIES: C4-dicarboxylate TRAP transporter substrate-binding protein [unclassified Martelella]